MKIRQLEMDVDLPESKPVNHRARWWFKRMREIVAQTPDFAPSRAQGKPCCVRSDGTCQEGGNHKTRP
jgi:hypothetical protein